MSWKFAPFACAALVAATACSDVAAPPAADDAPQPFAPSANQIEAVMPGEVLVKMKDGASLDAVLGGPAGLKLNRVGVADEFAVLDVAVGAEREEAARLAADPNVEWAEPNYLRHPTAIDSRLWAFYNPGGLPMTYTKGKNSGSPISGYSSLSDADEDAINGIAAGGSPVVIGSIDTGVDMSHPEFTGRLIAGHDWYSNDNDPSDTDDHGTHTTGTMAGATVGIAGVTGAAANVKVYVQRVCGRRGCPVSAISNAIRAAADYPNMVAVNVSIGGTSLSNSERDAIQYALDRNVLVFAAAGNASSGTVECPACDPNAISVSATNWQDQLAYYSSWGPGLDISAPGGELYSNTNAEPGIYSSIRGGYGYMQGTSMATPQVTGAAGVVASVTGLRGAQLRARLESTADDIGSSGYDTTFGNGRLNVYRAITGQTLSGGQ